MDSLPSPRMPQLSSQDKEALADYWRFYEPNAAAINVELMKVIERLPNWGPIIKAMSPEQMEAQNKRGMDLQRAALLDGNWSGYLADLHEQGKGYAKAGISFAAWFEILAVYRDAMRNRVAPIAREDARRATAITDGMNRMLDLAMSHIGEAYLATKEEIIRNQQEAIREISTPVLQVRDQLLIAPIVGVVDTHRARQLTDSLLRNIRERRARGVVMDITGVPIVDSSVANHLAQACQAARLMGAIVVVSGISAEIAQTLVAIGADLGGVRTSIDLQGGMEAIEEILAAKKAALA